MKIASQIISEGQLPGADVLYPIYNEPIYITLVVQSYIWSRQKTTFYF